MANNNAVFHFDELKMYFGEDYIVNGYGTIHTPTVGEIVEFGEQDYYSVISTLTAIPSDMKSILYDMGIDYETISDFEFFYLLTRGCTQDMTRLLFGTLDLSQMELYKDTQSEQYVLYHPQTGEKIDELAYLRIAGYLRKLHGLQAKVEKAANPATKKILLELDRNKRKNNQEKEYSSQLKPLISAMMRYPGFKYKSRELKDCSIYEFMDTLQGAQIYVASTSLLQGSYSGMIDTSKISKKEFDWMRSIS
jgi:hypothetical protein